MTLQDLMQEAQGLTWQEQIHLATRLLQWAEAQRASQEEMRQLYADQALVAAAAKASGSSLAAVWDNPEDAAYDDR
jgi:hypothetical protein